MGNEEATSGREKKDKGKDVERETPSSPTGQDNVAHVEASSDLASITSRLGASTSKLANSMIPWHLDSAHMADAVPSPKAESSRVSQYLDANETASNRDGPTRTLADSMFKSLPTHEKYAQGESDFSTFLDGASIPEVTEPTNTKLCGYEQNHGPGVCSGQAAQTAAIARSDGKDVVALLDSSRYDEVNETDVNLTHDEQTMLRYRLFEDNEMESRIDASQGRQWENALNFFPGSGLDSNIISEYTDLFGTSDIEEARGLWIDQWRRVLSSYAEEVWGGLSPLVSLAREEVRPLRPGEDPSPSELKALRRLQQILVHVRGT
ncbi:hypothetical protein GGR53DRAFT_515514 [Hypoxylon sp. FL1150]|nr:hypothetical protein GGR53DRAFT_515514 [Hypoxylon sp. FL1150]